MSCDAPIRANRSRVLARAVDDGTIGEVLADPEEQWMGRHVDDAAASPSTRITRELDVLAATTRLPTAFTTDNGPEFTSREFDAWAHRHGCISISFALGSRWRTASSRASTASSAMSA